MKKIAIVVQRCGKDVVGGSEGYALQMATILSEHFDVEILSSTAKDYISWKNHYNTKIEEISDTLRIKRFKVDFEREHYWHELNRILFNNLFLDKFSALVDDKKADYIKKLRENPFGLQEEWMKAQGPYSSSLLDYLKTNFNEYDQFLFMTYLYPTTYFGLDMMKDQQKVFIIPTLHDEPPAYLSILKKYAAFNFLFLTKAEKELAEDIFKCESLTDIIGFGIEDRFSDINSKRRKNKFILYAGRLDEGKGVLELYKQFEKFSKIYPDIFLYTIGDGTLKEYKHKKIKYLGFVSEEEKLSLMRDAIAFIHPSAYESLGIVLLESFMMQTPALVNKRCKVLNDHIIDSKGGYAYSSYDEFKDSLLKVIKEKDVRKKLGKNARQYFLDKYSKETYKQKLKSILDGTS